MKILEHIRTPEDLRNLPEDQLPLLATEMRQMILETVSRNGGHFASNFGVVELTIALHRVFHTPDDVLIWDVGHQSYCHKLLTGRQELFQTLRQMDGCAPFQSRRESPEYDPIGGGHAGTAISAALGIQMAAQQRGEKRFAVAILGDGALTCGISLEALNNVGGSGCPMVIVLNDNRMSISSNVGGVSSLLENGTEGLLYPAEDTAALSNAILKMLDDPDFARSCGQKARLRALDTHDPDQNSSTMLDIYRQITGSVL